MTWAAVSLRDVVKRYRSVTALRGVSIDVLPGEAVALLGPNGAGKTTAIRIMLGLRRPDAGTARLFGRDPRLPSARQAVGAAPQDLEFPGTLRIAEIVDFARRHYGDPPPLDELLERFGLENLARRQAGGLSSGQRRRLAVALAFAGRPSAVFLDEPTTGLDVESRRAVWAAVAGFNAAGGTVVLTTHDLQEAEALASRIAVIAAGRVVREGSVPGVVSSFGATDLEQALLSLGERRNR